MPISASTGLGQATAGQHKYHTTKTGKGA